MLLSILSLFCTIHAVYIFEIVIHLKIHHNYVNLFIFPLLSEYDLAITDLYMYTLSYATNYNFELGYGYETL